MENDEEVLDINDNSLFDVSSEEIEQNGQAYDKFFAEQASFFDSKNQRQQIESINGIKLEDTQWAEQMTFAEDAGQLAYKNVNDVADAKETSPNTVLQIKDIGEGLMAGVYEALRATQEMGAWIGGKIAEIQTGGNINFDPDKDTQGWGFNQGRYPDQQTTAGNLARTASQVSVGLGETALLGGFKAAKGLAGLAKNNFGRKLIQSVMNAATGLMTDTMSFSANEDNLAEVLKQLGLPTMEQIVKSEDDSFWTKKIKNGVDGILSGILIDFISKSAKMFVKYVPPEAVQAAGQAALLGYGAKQLFENEEAGEK